MNTVRLPRVGFQPALDRGPDAVTIASPRPVQRSANSTQFAAAPFADRPWSASSRRERTVSAAAAFIACACSLGSVVGLFASMT